LFSSADVSLVNVVVPSMGDDVVTVDTSGKVMLTVCMVELGADVVLLLSELLVDPIKDSIVELLGVLD